MGYALNTTGRAAYNRLYRAVNSYEFDSKEFNKVVDSVIDMSKKVRKQTDRSEMASRLSKFVHNWKDLLTHQESARIVTVVQMLAKRKLNKSKCGDCKCR
jgi:hypothetical protein